MPNADVIRAKREAASLLDAYPAPRLPVKVEQLAQQLGAEITYERFDDDESISAMLYRDDFRTVIGVNSCHPITRQRFSIAHEIGHMILHEGELYVDRSARINFRNELSSQAVDPKEIEANVFAAELLMPEAVVVREAYKLIDDKRAGSAESLISQMATKFKVSAKAMGFRLTNLRIITSSIDD
ncbi:MAG: ImmA/IrrE family metallo-endopeptidase [Alloalcanivorax sp.]